MFPLDISYLRPKLGDDNRLYFRYGAEYADKVLGYSPIAYWPLWEASGLTAKDISGNGNDGTYANVTLGQEGIGDGRTCPLFNGTSSYISIGSAGLNSVFSGALGAVMIWCKVFNAAVWADSAYRRAIALQADSDNNITLHKSDTEDQLALIYEAGGTQEQHRPSLSAPTDWFQIIMTWDKAGDKVEWFHNGSSLATSDTLGLYAGALSADDCAIGARNVTPSQLWKGYLVHAALFDTVITSTVAEDLYTL